MSEEKPVSEKKEPVSVTGFLGQSPSYKILEEKSLAVANFSLAINHAKQTKWVNCTAWGELADKVKNLEKGVRLSVVGTEVPKEKDGKDFSYLSLKEVVEHSFIKDLPVVIGNIDFKTPKNKEICEIAAYNNTIQDGKQSSELLKVAAFGKLKDNLKEEKVKVGDKLLISADGKPFSYQNKEGETVSGIQYTLVDFRSAEIKQETKKEAPKKKVTAKKPKSKGADMSM